MRRKHLIWLFIAAFTAALSPCVEAAAYAVQKQHCDAGQMSCCAKMHKAEQDAAAKKAVSHCGKHSSEDHGQCSNLCHCTCCGHVVTAFFAFVPLLQVYLELREKPNYYSSYHFDYTHLIWQPPRWG